MRLLEGVAVALHQQEPALLVGETGTGKTTLVQRLADQVMHDSLPGVMTHVTWCSCMLLGQVCAFAWQKRPCRRRRKSMQASASNKTDHLCRSWQRCHVFMKFRSAARVAS